MHETKIKVFGIPMQRRNSRRKLVAATYAVLAVMCALSIAVAHHDSSFYVYPIYAAIVVGGFVFGGLGRNGLLKAFVNRPPRPELGWSPMVQLQLQPQSAGTRNEATWKNDERELSQRDLAHYRAYQPMSLGVFLLLLLTTVALRHPSWISATTLLVISFAVTEVMAVLALTLPSAIILWTEPDMDTL